ncbi:DUF1996 domain-containing protein [Actinoplanes sp. NPDC049265]|uniref:DUF1996 domain-containing protein n=1 Tax=Actinoplanes sp. NPDC049265 TaxID=3363902 RepID=UPI003715BC25
MAVSTTAAAVAAAVRVMSSARRQSAVAAASASRTAGSDMGSCWLVHAKNGGPSRPSAPRTLDPEPRWAKALASFPDEPAPRLDLLLHALEGSVSLGSLPQAPRRRLPRPAVLLGAAITLLVGVPAALWLVPNVDAAETGIPAGAIRAASYAAQSGVQQEGSSDVGGGRAVGWLANGDWMRFDGVDLGPAGTVSTSLRFSAAYRDRPGSVEMRLDSQTGMVLATVPVSYTGGWAAWRTATVTGSSSGGKHAVFLMLKSAQPMDFVNLNWFSVGGDGADPSPTASASSAPAPASPQPSDPASSGPKPSDPTPPATATPPAAGWIPVDQARWDAQVAEFKELKPRPVPAGKGHNAEFNATCEFSHAKPDDPIVFPNMAGASHMHSIFGNKGLDAFSTPESLTKFTASSCKPIEDHSAYWVPELREHGVAVEPDEVVVYYGSLLEDKSKTMPMPFGLRMLVGDPKKQVDTPKGAVNQFYCAGGPQDGASRSTDGNWPVCDGGKLHFTLRFPDCWDGKHLDSPNHRDHVAFGQGGKCTATHPVPIPALTFSIAYPTSGSKDGFALSSGKASSMHGDAFFAWEDTAMAERVKNCVVQVTPCNTAGQF